jgi:hypothetical protein
LVKCWPRVLDEESGTLDQNSASPVPATQLATSANPSARQTGDLSSKTIAGRYEPAKVDTLQQPFVHSRPSRTMPEPPGEECSSELLSCCSW